MFNKIVQSANQFYPYVLIMCVCVLNMNTYKYVLTQFCYFCYFRVQKKMAELMTPEQAAQFVEKCEQEFKDRYSSADKSYQQITSQPQTQPPLVISQTRPQDQEQRRYQQHHHSNHGHHRDHHGQHRDRGHHRDQDQHRDRSHHREYDRHRDHSRGHY